MKTCDLTESMRTTPLTTVLASNGATVLARLHRGEPYPVTYANRTQAERAVAKLGPGWTVGHWTRPFYAMRMDEPEVTITPAADAVRPLKPELADEPEAICECQNCDWTGPESALGEIADFFERVDSGEECPAGECPKCGCLVHPPQAKPVLRVVVEVEGGVAEVTTCPPGVEVEIVDHDTNDEED